MINTRIIAHRGLSSLYPENTLIAMEKASDIGATWVETDVQILKDTRPVLIHDYDLNRTATIDKQVPNLSILDIQDIDVGSWFDKRFHQERIPTLREFLKHMYTLNVGVNLEIKYHKGYHDQLSSTDHDQIVSSIMKVVATAPTLPRGILISSFFRPFLTLVRKYNKSIPIGYLCHEYQEDIIEFAQSIGIISLHFAKDMLLSPDNHYQTIKNQIKEIKSKGLYLYVYTVNDLKDAEILFDLEVDGIFTDYPQDFSQYF